ncbi:flagellar hook-associated protein 1 FlgK [Lachnospiraceae bacterium XBD2001]|nr:flagellar hook-associated protein 1 FlgK [Lachnospiraceae bacterium XBD2001]
MANGFGSLYVGASGLRNSQNALNVVANNLSNLDTKGYVRQQVVFQDVEYNKFAIASISDQYTGLGVSIADVVHARDQFLDRAYRTTAGRYSFYQTNYDAIYEVETQLQEGTGNSFATAIDDLYGAFAEFAKNPSDSVSQNLIAQKAALFLSRADAVYEGFCDYQDNINVKVTNDIKRINEIGKKIHELNIGVQRIEAGGIETAMDLRDARDALIDELSSLCNITYSETFDGILKVKIEGSDFVTEVSDFPIDLYTDKSTGFVTPYWPLLSQPRENKYYEVFNLDHVDAEHNNDIGEIKALLLSRGDHRANYTDIAHISSREYESGVGNSVMMNQQAEMDTMIHYMVTVINNMFSPIDDFSKVYDTDPKNPLTYPITVKGLDGKPIKVTKETKVLDVNNCCVGSKGTLPPTELFTRVGSDRYTPVTMTINGKEQTVYLYNEEDWTDESKCYTLNSLVVNKNVVENPNILPYRYQNGDIAYDMAQSMYEAWDAEKYVLNPSDVTPCSFADFYTKWVGEIATVGSIYKNTSESLSMTKDQTDNARTEVLGVSSDEELTNMIKFQNAYNASSRYMNVVSEMIDYLLQSL